MIYFWAIIAVIVLFLIVRFMKWYRLPEQVKEDQINLEKKQSWWNFRLARRHKTPVTPVPVVAPTPDVPQTNTTVPVVEEESRHGIFYNLLHRRRNA
jgi:hypothetical protein